MQAIDRMNAAYDAEWALWHLVLGFEGHGTICRKGDDKRVFVVEKLTGITLESLSQRLHELRGQASMRAALRALAEITPTPAMSLAVSKRVEQSIINNYGAPLCEEDIWDGFSLALETAASEGERP